MSRSKPYSCSFRPISDSRRLDRKRSRAGRNSSSRRRIILADAGPRHHLKFPAPYGFVFRRGLNDGNLGCPRCYTVVLHRQFPAVREMPDSEGILRCRKPMAEREELGSNLLHVGPGTPANTRRKWVLAKARRPPPSNTIIAGVLSEARDFSHVRPFSEPC